jgi:hypothetical protein
MGGKKKSDQKKHRKSKRYKTSVMQEYALIIVLATKFSLKLAQ